jgi:diacylglycerol kinase family enzyme
MYAKIVFKHKRHLPVMSVYRSGKIVIRCPEPMPTQLDGDITGEATKVTVQVDPGSLLIRVRALPGITQGGSPA